MSIGTQAFTVLTEFKFDIGAAIASSDAVASRVEKISGAAERAQFALARMSLSFAGSMLGGGGFLGAMFAASRVADDFANNQIALANTLVMTGMAFEDRMGAAASTMKDLNKLAIDNSLSFKDLLSTTKLLTPMLLNKGMAGRNLGNVTDISRTFLKSAPTLGIDPGEAMGQLMRTMEGQASMGDTLFTRLAAETAPMKEFLNNTKKWNALNPHKRIELLRKALAQFADDSGAVNARVKTLSGQMAVLKNNIELLLMPIGNMINKFLATALGRINSPELMSKAKSVSDSFAKILGDFLTTPEKLYADMAQAKALAGDTKSAGKSLLFYATMKGAIWLLGQLGIKVSIFSIALKGISYLFSGLAMIGRAIMSIGLFTFFNGLVVIISSVLVPLLAITAAFQFLSRSLAYAKMFALEGIAKQMPRIMAAMEKFSAIFSIFGEGFDLLARAFGSFLDPTKFLGFIDLIGLFAGTLEFLAEVFGKVMMTLNGVAFYILEMFNQVKSFLMGNGYNSKRIEEVSLAGMELVYDKIFGKKEEGNVPVMNQNVNMDVKMQNNFKEMMEPDRVAFTIRDQLLKAARNQTGARDRGMEAAGAAAGR